MQIESVFIAGGGLMGSGIAQVCAQSGLEVVLCDVDQGALARALKSMAWSVAKLVDKGAVSGSVDQVMGRIRTSSRLEDVSGADLAVEAVYERLDLKRQVFRQLDGAAPPHAILASNTSAISITELAACTARPAQVAGLHFFSPVPMMRAVEVVRGMGTSDETMAACRQLVLRLGKQPVMVQRDIPGFLLNRINLPSNIEAMRLLEQGVGTVEEIDQGLCLAMGRKMGPFETGDLVGLDVTLGALTALYEETREGRWYPPLILRRKVAAGQLGKKAGRGWYIYDADGKRLGPA